MFIVILFLVAVGHVATDLYLPSLPAIAKYFATSVSITQITVSCYLLCLAFSALLFGPLSDVLGRKKVILFGLIIAIIATTGCCLATNIYFLMAARMLQGIAMGAIIVAAKAMVPDLYSGQALAKCIAQIAMWLALILNLATTLGGYIQEHFHWRVIFVVMLSYLGILLGIWAKIPETLTINSNKKVICYQPKTYLACYRELFANVPFILYGIYSVIPFSGMFAYLTVSPFLFQTELGLSPAAYGNLFLYLGIGTIVFGYLNTKLIQCLALDTLLYISAICIGIAGSLLWWLQAWAITSVIATIAVIFLFYFAVTMSIANATSKAFLCLTTRYGSARALLAIGQFFSGSIGSWLMAMSPTKQGKYLAWYLMVNAGVMLLGLLLAKGAISNRKKTINLTSTSN